MGGWGGGGGARGTREVCDVMTNEVVSTRSTTEEGPEVTDNNYVALSQGYVRLMVNCHKHNFMVALFL